MKQITIKELALYLPYGLKMYDFQTGDIVPLLGIDIDAVNFKGGYDEYDWWNISAFKPILRPLSDLTKEIKVNGERFVPIERISIYNPNSIQYSIEQIKVGLIEYIVMEKLFSWHFDAFGLLDRNLAIDINKI